MDQRTVAWRAIGLIVSSALPLVLLLWVLTGPANAHETISVHTNKEITVSVQATPTVDSTMTALQKQQLQKQIDLTQQQIQQAKNQNFWTGWMSISSALLPLVTIMGVFVAYIQFRISQGNQRQQQRDTDRITQTKQDEDRFQTFVAGLGSKDVEARAGAAILLRTFLQEDKGYEEFYQQVFDLAVTHLRLRKADPNTSRYPDSLSQALITVFKESFLRVRKRVSPIPPGEYNEFLDASSIQLDNAYLDHADLGEARLMQASLCRADLFGADLTRARLRQATLIGADLRQATLIGANLFEANLTEANLQDADLTQAEQQADQQDTHHGTRSGEQPASIPE